MKTAAAVVVVLALLGMFPKHKKRHPERVIAPPARVQLVNRCANPDTVVVDPASVSRIVKFGMTLYRKPFNTEQEMTRIATLIVRYAVANCIEPELAGALIARESGYNTHAVSRTGAKGLGQLIDSTARMMGVRDAFDAEDNLRGALAYFKGLLDKWEGYPDQVERALASYNVGPAVVEKKGAGAARGFYTSILTYRDKIHSM